MSSQDNEIQTLKQLVRAQDKMILHYRIGKSSMPEWVFKAINDAKKLYEVSNISDIR